MSEHEGSSDAEHDAATGKAQTLEELLAELSRLKEEHRRLDEEVMALQTQGVTDMMKIARMKKLKLRLKDRIAFLTDQINPDIIA